MKVSIEDIKLLREQTAASLADVKYALEQAEGDYEKALKVLFEKGLTSATKKMEREANQGIIYSYVHNFRIGVMIELNCETDFVARNTEFVDLAKDLAIQIVLNDPKYIDSSEVEDSKEDVKDFVLLMQPYFKDSSITIEELIKRSIAKFGENIKVRRFYKMSLGI
ncbi:MAG: translation elongation factor Ts [bacterium]